MWKCEGHHSESPHVELRELMHTVLVLAFGVMEWSELHFATGVVILCRSVGKAPHSRRGFLYGAALEVRSRHRDVADPHMELCGLHGLMRQ